MMRPTKRIVNPDIVPIKDQAITQELLNAYLRYEPETGSLFWKRRPSMKTMAGSEAGCLDRSTNYYRIRIGKKLYESHRVIWMMVFGRWPIEQIDHIDRNRSNNRLTNLREVTHKQNQWNKQRPVTPNRPFRGVYQRKGRFYSKIRVNGIQISLGTFGCQIAAAKAYDEAAKQYRGEFAQLNFDEQKFKGR